MKFNNPGVSMHRSSAYACIVLLLLSCVLPIVAQEQAVAANAVVPRLVNYSGTLTDLDGKAITTNVVGVTFALYKDSQGGAPLWLETQNVRPDRNGHYSVTLGSTSAHGLPADVFASGEARWLGVQIEGQTEQARVLLVAVPYALKSGDAETLGGLPASAFMLAAPVTVPGASSTADGQTSSNIVPAAAAITGTGTTGFLPDFTGASTLGNSAVFQSGASPNAKIGINTNAPTTTLDVHGGAAIRGAFVLPTSGTATAAAGANSQPENVAASAFNSTTSTAVPQTFQIRAEPVNNNTPNATASLNVLFGQGTSTPVETGLKIGSNGKITFAPGQTFPGTGPGTVTRVNTGLGLTGGPITSSGTLAIDTSIVPRLNVANTWSTNQTILGSLGVNGGISAGGSLGVSGDVSVIGSLGVNNGITTSGSIGLAGNVSAGGTISGSSVFGGTLSASLGETFGNTIQFTDSGVASQLQPPLMINAEDCCDFGDRMIWAHSPSFSTWGIYYDDDNDVMHWQEDLASNNGFQLMTLDFFNGNLNVTGTITGAAKNFRIDHPLDPTNKFLDHTSVESSEMMNIYTGNAVLDGNGKASVKLPDWFEAVNEDFRYQLTAIGAAAPGLHVAREIADHEFSIGGGAPGMKVSWQVTAVRHDPYAKVHPLVVEVNKTGKDRGAYLHPDAYGKPRLSQKEMFRLRKQQGPSKGANEHSLSSKLQPVKQ